MAITKILHINEVDMGNPARHLEQALDYIQNPEKTNGNVLVGSINCLPETAFEQMMDTKMTFGKMDKRQGYHIIISFVPRETTEEIAFDIVERFAKEYLKDEYEAVYTVQVPEYPYGDERAETVMDVVENDLDAVGDMEVSVEVKANAEEYIDDKNLSEAESTDVEENMDKSVNYESFMSMSPEDMAGILGFDRIVGIDEVHSKVSSFFRDVKSYVDGNEIMDVAKLVYKGMRANFIKQRAEEIVEAINSMGLSYPCLTDKEKAELFRFLPDDNNYNLELHMAVLKACGLKLEFDEVYEDYQRIYDKTMEMQDEKMNERGESVRGRAR